MEKMKSHVKLKCCLKKIVEVCKTLSCLIKF